MNIEVDIIPNDQQEDENDLQRNIAYKDAVVVNSDWTIETISLQINKGRIDLEPGFQRRNAWDPQRKSRLIESIIVGMPVPNIVLAENKSHSGRFIVIDGKQRLLAISEFMKDEYKLKGLDIRYDLNDKKFSDLSQDDREYLENATLRSTLIRNWSDNNFLFALFFRLNSGSLPLSPQELRRALIGGNLLDAIDTYLTSSQPFKDIFGEKLDRRMRDSELVLRFIAFDSDLEGYQGDFKDFLDKTTKHFESNWHIKQGDLQLIFQKLDVALSVTRKVFGDDAFKKWVDKKYERVINRAIFDAVARFFSDPAVATAAIGKEIQIAEALQDLCLTQEFKDAIEKTPKTKSATYNRINLWGSALANCVSMHYAPNIFRIV